METNTLSDHIIAFLGSARSTRVYYQILRDQRIKRYKESSVRSALHRMSTQGVVKKTNTGWRLVGKENRGRTEDILGYIPSPFPKEAARQTIIAFDIPETKRIARRWLRNQLKIFGYKMLQRSLWRGPGPLPKNFMERLKKLEIRDGVQIFIVAGSMRDRNKN